VGKKTSEGRNPKEVTAGHLAKPQGPGRNFRGVLDPEVGSAGVSALGGNHRRGAALERAYGEAEGGRPRRENPKGGFEMK